jgi:hypothetical protein
MNYRYNFLLALLCIGTSSILQAESMNAVEKKSSVPLSLTKTAAGTACTAGSLYALVTFIKDVKGSKKRYPAADSLFSSENKYRLVTDSFTLFGLLYLTYMSGLFTFNELKELLSKFSEDELVNKQ